MERDGSIKLAFSVQSSPGQYALLLGSGISHAANIPTGEAIAKDLIQKYAERLGESPSDPWNWFEKTKGEPNYSNILDKLTSSEPDRKGLIANYFEPTEKDRNEKKKIPTKAHQAIARLVSTGYIRVIITTNFDNLLERALQELNIVTPVVVTEDNVSGTEPYPRNSCTIIKVNGDYLHSKMKNTHSELSKYTPQMNVYLDRIFNEHGLIVCGWSARNDVALIKAIERSQNRRYSTFWCLHNITPTSDEQHLITHLKPIVLTDINAEDFFPVLADDVDGIAKNHINDPITIETAVNRTKTYLAEEKLRIKLYDLVYDEIEYVYNSILTEEQTPIGDADAKEFYQQRIRRYENLVKPLAHILVTIANHDNGNYSEYFTDAIDRLASIPKIEYNLVGQLKGRDRETEEINKFLEQLHQLRLYPALLLIYSTSIVSLKRHHYKNIGAIVDLPRRYEPFLSGYEKIQLYKIINFYEIFGEKEQWILPMIESSHKMFAYDYLSERIYEIVRVNIPTKHIFEEIFDNFEFLRSMMYVDSNYKILESGDWERKQYVFQYFPNEFKSKLWIETTRNSSMIPIKITTHLKEFIEDLKKAFSKNEIPTDIFGGNESQYQKCSNLWNIIYGIQKKSNGP